MQTYEVEVKALLGSAERAEAVRAALTKADPACRLTSHNSQLNHYFEQSADAAALPKAALEKLSASLAPYLESEKRARLDDLAARASSFSVRTREKDGTVLIVVKASADDTTSENGIKRMEFEEALPLSLSALDDLVIASGFRYQAKWSRDREEYLCRGINVCIDKNAGYGYLAEFELVIDDESALKEAESKVRALMAELGVEELPQDRLGRMFAFYNTHWPEYYGTDNIFHVE